MNVADTHNKRPDFIPRELFRTPMTAYALGKYFRVGKKSPAAFISASEQKGRPIRHIKDARELQLYRPIDIVARAYAETVSVDNTTRHEAVSSVYELTRQISELKNELERAQNDLDGTKHQLQLSNISCRLTNNKLLSNKEILKGRMHLPFGSGVYFLVHNDAIVYVGQSTQVMQRIAQHIKDKKFDSFAFIPCERAGLNALESLYIHLIRPDMNGRLFRSYDMQAPMSISQLKDALKILEATPTRTRKKVSGWVD